MSPKLKKILSTLFIAASIFAVVIIAFSNPEMGNGWEAISGLEIPWIGGLLLCWIAFAGFETLGNQICLNKRGCRISFLRTFRTGLPPQIRRNPLPKSPPPRNPKNRRHPFPSLMRMDGITILRTLRRI